MRTPTGCIYLPKGRTTYMLKWTDALGKIHRRSAGTTDPQEADRLLLVKLGRLADGEPNTPGRLTWQQAIDLLRTNYTLKRNKSWSHVDRRLRLHLTPLFGKLLMGDITSDMIDAFAASRLDAGAKPSEINRCLAVIKRMFRVAIEKGRLHHRPLFTMLDESDNVRQGFFEADEFDAFREALPDWLQGPCTLAYFTGWRFHDEVLSLQWQQIDRRAKEIRLASSKNGSGRVISYRKLPAVGAVLDLAWQVHEAAGKTVPHVFHHDGKALCESNGSGGRRWTFEVRRAWEAARKATGLLTKIPHDFRRTAARNLVRAGVSESRVMKITGHKTRSVFLRYDINNLQDMDDAFEALTVASTPAPARRTGTLHQFPR